MRVAAAWADARDMLIVRFGDNMNCVAVTDGDRLEAEMRLGYHVDYYGIGDLVEYQDKVTEADVDALVSEYETLYDWAENCWQGAKDHNQVREAAREEIALRRFLKDKGAKAFTTNFNALHGLNQLPGLACQRLMAEGYGFGAEGDWKTAALVRTLWVMAQGLPGGTSFMEDYTYHFQGEKSAILQAHMLEISPEITTQKPRLEVHPLGIGGKSDPARLVFPGKSGAAIVASLVDMGGRLRLIVNDIECVEPYVMPKLPVAATMWKPMPNLEISAEAWILSGAAHHSVLSFDLNAQHLCDWAEIMDIEFIHIHKDTNISDLKRDLFLADLAWKLK
jgi:L-arabinose isomerase